MSPNPPTRRRLVAIAAVAATVLATAQASPAVADNGRIRHTHAAKVIKGSYIVVFKDGAVPKKSVRGLIDRLAVKHKASVRFRYADALRGFSARMSEAHARKLATDPSVDFVEQDRTVRIAATQTPTPSWGLDRLDQANLPLSNSYT